MIARLQCEYFNWFPICLFIVVTFNTRLASDHSFLLFPSFVCLVQVFLDISYLVLVFVVFYIKMPQMSALKECCCEYQNVVNFASICLHIEIENAAKLKNTTNIRLQQIFKCHTFQSPVNVPFYSHLCPTFSLCLPTFILVFYYLKTSLFP